MAQAPQHIFIVTGPTASGKSGLAAKLGQQINGVIINADSQQIYREIPIITAQPSADEQALCPHRLYGHHAVTDHYDVAQWLREATEQINQCQQNGQTPILVGGTGFYLKALLDGITAMPEVPLSRVEALTQRWHDETPHDPEDDTTLKHPHPLYTELEKCDPELASKLAPYDQQRIIRGLSFFEETGQKLSAQQAEPPVPPPSHWRFHMLILIPEREGLYGRINTRFDAMVDEGVMNEIRALAGMLPDDFDPMRIKSDGVRELWPLLALDPNDPDYVSLFQHARAETQQKVRNYAKRQLTWMRQQLIAQHAPYVVCYDMKHPEWKHLLCDLALSWAKTARP